MALNFGILQPVNIAGNIMAGRQEAQRNQLAQQQLQTGAMQQEKAQMEMADFKAKQAGLDKFLKMSQANGKTGTPEELASSFYDFALTQRDPQLIMAAQTMRQAARERSAYNASRLPPKISPVGPAADTFDFGQQNEPVLQPNVPGTAVSTPVRPMVNQLAPPPAAAAPVNQLGVDTIAIENRINELRTNYPNLPDAQKEADRLEKRLEESRKLYTVGGNLVTGTGKSVFTAPEKVTPSEIKRLTAERDALQLTDPNRKLYDQAIANLGSTERLAQERLNFDRQKFAWEKSNPGYTIQQSEDGSIVGVNNRTLQAFPVSLNATPPPVATPFGGGGARAPGGAGKRGGVVAPVAEPIIQPRGAPLKGKSAGLTESQGNATAFGLRMQESHSALKDLEKKGETNTGVIGGTVGGVVGLVPLIGDKLTAGVDNIYNVLPQVLGGYSPEQQKTMNGRINFITAVLRKESGAAISPGEFVTAEKLYFPRPGDDDSVVKQKQRARELAIKAMKIQAGPGAKSIEETTPSESGASASDPLGLFTNK
jgi:hypothetical protein